MPPNKALPDAVVNFFKGESVFYHNTPKNDPSKPVKSDTITTTGISKEQPAKTKSTVRPKEDVVNKNKIKEVKADIHKGLNEEVKNNVMTDVMTSPLQDVNLKTWQEVIENTETQNSALRLTPSERYSIEDVVNDLRRKTKIKTSMNEIARLGLLFMIHDFRKNGFNSILYKVKKA